MTANTFDGEKEHDNEQVLKYWMNKKNNIDFDEKFECERYIQLTNQERYNLQQLKIFRNFEWFVETSQKRTGNSFGELALHENQDIKHLY